MPDASVAIRELTQLIKEQGGLVVALAAMLLFVAPAMVIAVIQNARSAGALAKELEATRASAKRDDDRIEALTKQANALEESLRTVKDQYGEAQIANANDRAEKERKIANLEQDLRNLKARAAEQEVRIQALETRLKDETNRADKLSIENTAIKLEREKERRKLEERIAQLEAEIAELKAAHAVEIARLMDANTALTVRVSELERTKTGELRITEVKITPPEGDPPKEDAA